MHEAPYRLIPLRARDGTIRAHAIVDDADYEWLTQWRWALHGRGYVQRGVTVKGKRIVILMHRLLLELEAGDKREGDHRNGNRLDNRRSNLRIATRAQNAQNRTVSRGSSRYVGVSYRAKYGTWHATAKVDGKLVCLGDFSAELDAAATAAQFRQARMPYAVEDPELLAYVVRPDARRRRASDAERAPEIRRRWLAGESLAEIAHAFGITRSGLGATMTRLRQAGHDLPYRGARWPQDQ